MSHATFRDIVHRFEAESDGPSTSCAAVRYALDDVLARRFKLRRSNAASLRRTGTKSTRSRSK